MSGTWKENASSYDQLAEFTGAGLWRMYIDGREPELSPQIMKIFGLKGTDIPSVEESLPRYGEPEKLTAAIERALSEGIPYDLEMTYRNFEEHILMIRTAGRPFYEDGKLAGLVGCLQDVTERHERQEEIRRLSTRLQVATESAAVGIWDWDVDNNVLAWDSVMYQLYGIEESDFGGAYEAWRAGLHPEDQAEADAEVQTVLSTGQPLDTTFRVVWPDGTVRYLRAFAKIVQGFGGAGRHVIGVNWDCTEVVEREQALLEAKLLAEAHSEAKSRFVSMVSHEIRTPLNAITSTAEVLRADYDHAPPVVEHVERIAESSGFLGAIISHLLDLTRIERGDLELRELPFSFQRVAAAALRVVAPEAERKRLEVRASFPQTELPEVVGDGVRLQQVLVNLLANAVKFTGEGHVALDIETREAEPDSVGVRIAVRDTGIGIPEDQLEAIFEDFAQADTIIARHYGGTGLGTTITRAIVQAMGGTIDVSSEPGEGTCFCVDVSLPRATTRTQAAPTPSLAQHQGRRALVVEDNLLNQTVARMLFERAGVDVEIADCGEAALKLDWSSFDVIFMDILMPGIDGVETSQRLREAGCLKPIIALTASLGGHERGRFWAAGMNGVLAKPLTPELLAGELERLFGPGDVAGGSDAEADDADSEDAAADDAAQDARPARSAGPRETNSVAPLS